MNKKCFIVALLSMLTSACQNNDQPKTSNRTISSVDSRIDAASTISDTNMDAGDRTSIIGTANRSTPRP